MPFDNGHDLTGQLESIDSAHVAQDAHENVPIGHGDDVNVVVSTLVVASYLKVLWPTTTTLTRVTRRLHPGHQKKYWLGSVVK